MFGYWIYLPRGEWTLVEMATFSCCYDTGSASFMHSNTIPYAVKCYPNFLLLFSFNSCTDRCIAYLCSGGDVHYRHWLRQDSL